MKILKTLLTSLILFTTYFAAMSQVGIGTDNPTNTLHIVPVDAHEEPLRVEGLKNYVQGDSTLLVVDPSTGVVRYLRIATLMNLLTAADQDIDETNEIQNAVQVNMAPSIDINGDNIFETNVQQAIEKLAQKVPKGTFKSIGEARAAGLADGDSFYADPQGVFGCSGCVITLHSGMN